MDRPKQKHVTPLPPASASASPMKRKAGQDSSDSATKRAPRQDPVSCESCRKKKLKCNRQQPCSSCVTRRLPCTYGMGSAGVQSPVGNVNQPQDMAVASRGRDVNRWPAVASSVVARPPDGQTSRDRNESLETADWLEKIVMGDRVTTGMPTMPGGGMSVLKAQDVLSPGQSTVAAGNALSMSWGEWTASQDNPATVQLISFLPKKMEAMALFHYYTGCIDYLYHITLPKRVEEQIHGIYQAIEKQEILDLNHLALLFSIVASALFLQLSIESSVYADACSREFTFLTGAALIQSNYSVYPTIEGLQSTLIVAHNLSNMSMHPSVSSLFVLGNIVGQAKNLMLHCIDSPRCREARKASGADPMEVELRRRLWWDLAAYDW